MKLNFIGKNLNKVDAPGKALGIAKYIDDYDFAGMLYGYVKLSDHPFAEIKRINTENALKIDGVHCILTSKCFENGFGKNQIGVVFDDQPLIADKIVRYTGDAIAIIAGESEEIARNAANQIEVDYEVFASISDIEESKNSKVNIHESGNICVHKKLRKGNLDKGFEKCTHIIEKEFRVKAQEHIYIETQGAIALVDETGVLTIYGSMQCPFYVQNDVSRITGLPLNKIRVIQTITGGGFGGKEDVPSIVCSNAALLALSVKRPVKLIYNRKDDILFSSKRHPMIMNYKYGFNDDGILKAVKINIDVNVGAYSSLSPIVLFRTLVHATGPYNIDDCSVDVVGYYSNTPPSGAFRGFGSPQTIFAHETMMEIASQKLCTDPVSLMEKNILVTGSKTATSQKMEYPLVAKEMLLRASEETDFTNKYRQYSQENKKNNRFKKGIGISNLYYGMALGAFGWYLDGGGAHVKVDSDGSVSVTVGNIDMGQGLLTVITQIVCEILQCSPQSVSIYPADTKMIPDSGPTVASRSTVISGNAVIEACNPILQNMKIGASKFFSVPVQEICLSNGEFSSTRGKATFKEIATYCYKNNICTASLGWKHLPKSNIDGETGQGDAYYEYCFGTNVAEVTVDTLTGMVKVDNITAVHDVGRAVNPAGCEGQVEGGTTQGLGWCLMENFVISKDAKVLSDTMSTYIIPTVYEMPDKVKTILFENPSAVGPFGVKGIGEPSVMPSGSAIAIAVSHALGKTVQDMPATPEYIMKLYKKSERLAHKI